MERLTWISHVLLLSFGFNKVETLIFNSHSLLKEEGNDNFSLRDARFNRDDHNMFSLTLWVNDKLFEVSV